MRVADKSPPAIPNDNQGKASVSSITSNDVKPLRTVTTDATPWSDEERDGPELEQRVPKRWDENPKRRGGKKRKTFEKANRRPKPTAITTPLKARLDLVMPVMVPEPSDGVICVLKSSQYVHVPHGGRVSRTRRQENGN